MAVGTIWFPKDAACNACQAAIGFRLTKAGRWQPISADHVPHGATCTPKRKPPRTTCPFCASASVETIYVPPPPPPHYATAHCLNCDRRWWAAKPEDGR